MRVYKAISIRLETLMKLEDVFGDINTINFSKLADEAILDYVKSVKNEGVKTMKNEIKRHYGPETVPIVRNTKENNKVFRENEKKDLPFFAIRKGPKMFYIEYDFIATTHILKEEVTKEIEEITLKMGQNSKYYGNSFHVYSMGQCVGITEKFPLNECKQYAPQIRDIIFNPNNWELSDAGRLKVALESNDPMAIVHYELETQEISRRKVQGHLAELI